VNLPAEIRKLLNDARSGSQGSILLRVKRDDVIRYVAVPLG
jgi:hypothetical protein